MVSPDRLRANPRKAQNGTWPKTAEGEALARCTALKHGLAGTWFAHPAEEAAERQRRTREWSRLLRPANAFEVWIVSQVVVASIHLARCCGIELGQRAVYQERAAACWEDDRRLEVEQLAAKLAKNPGLIRQQLRATSQGCEWLIARWEALVRVLDHHGAWTDDERARALDLLGVPLHERELDPSLPPDEPVEALRAVAATEIKSLTRKRDEDLADPENSEQALAAWGLGFDISLPARLLRRYEASCESMLFWGLSQLSKSKRSHQAGTFAPAVSRLSVGSTQKRLAQLASIARTDDDDDDDEDPRYGSLPPHGIPQRSVPRPAAAPARPSPAAPAKPSPAPAEPKEARPAGTSSPASPTSIGRPVSMASAIVPHRHMNRRQRRAQEQRARKNS
ncbi:MAG TPA: hypothetical protein VGZ22_05740 [Isosphaeraceae bacterium]|jgi:hypothetical protein|nr:hypothetical protein [Isosphaeraceae bacterium]